MSNLSVRQALDDVRDAEASLTLAVESNFPSGSKVFWRHGTCGVTQFGVVLRTVCDKVVVRNDRTGKQRALYAFWFTSEFGGGLQN